MHGMRADTPVVLTTLLTLAAGGCLEREEKITVEADGGVTIRVELDAGSESELYGGDPVPSVEGGWVVEVDDDAHRLTAAATFEPERGLPESFATAGDPWAHRYVRFPTRVTREERADGTYYHFHRVYPRRSWARVEAFQRDLDREIEDDIGEKDFEELTLEEKVSALGALTRFDNRKRVTLARLAFVDVSPDGPQDGWLRLRAGLRGIGDDEDLEVVASLMQDEDQAEGMFESLLARMNADAADVVASTLEDFAGYTETELDRFMRRLMWYDRRVEIMQNERFQIDVEMPGRIVGSNADSVDGGTASWKFDASRLGIGDVELMVSSFVPRG